MAKRENSSSLFNIKNILIKAKSRRKVTMVKIRLKRLGEKKSPFYRVIVADSRSPRNGRFIEELGTYDPNYDPSRVNIDVERTKQWLANGAQPTDGALRVFKIAGIEK